MRLRWIFLGFLGLLLPMVAIGTAAALEGHDPFCSACHTEPEVAYVSRSLFDPTDLASAHTPAEVRCVDCHSGEGLFGRSISLQQGASDLAAYVSGNYAQPAITTNPVGEVGCTKCHNAPSSLGVYARTQIGVTSSHYHFHEYAAEWLSREPDAGGSCGKCHKAHMLDTLANQGYVIDSELKSACEECHAALSGWVPPARQLNTQLVRLQPPSRAGFLPRDGARSVLACPRLPLWTSQVEASPHLSGTLLVRRCTIASRGAGRGSQHP